MFRLVSSAFLAFATLASGQPPAAPATPPVTEKPAVPPTRVVLRALPLGGDEDINSKALEGGEAVVPVKPVLPAAPAPPPIVQATPIETVSPPSPLHLKPMGDDGLRLQIFLDEAKFGPGVIDGKSGQFTILAA